MLKYTCKIGDNMYIVIVTAILIVLVFILIEAIYYNHFQMARIRISEAENNIEILLQKKFCLLERTIKIIEDSNKKYQEDQVLASLIKLKNKKLNNFELNKELEQVMAEYKGLIDLDPKLNEIESLNHISFELIEIENDLNAAKNYYNDTIVAYNKLVKCLPSNFVAILFHYKRKDFYIDEKVEVFEILKKK